MIGMLFEVDWVVRGACVVVVEEASLRGLSSLSVVRSI